MEERGARRVEFRPFVVTRSTSLTISPTECQSMCCCLARWIRSREVLPYHEKEGRLSNTDTAHAYILHSIHVKDADRFGIWMPQVSRRVAERLSVSLMNDVIRVLPHTCISVLGARFEMSGVPRCAFVAQTMHGHVLTASDTNLVSALVWMVGALEAKLPRLARSVGPWYL